MGKLQAVTPDLPALQHPQAAQQRRAEVGQIGCWDRPIDNPCRRHPATTVRARSVGIDEQSAQQHSAAAQASPCHRSQRLEPHRGVAGPQREAERIGIRLRSGERRRVGMGWACGERRAQRQAESSLRHDRPPDPDETRAAAPG